MIQKLVDTVSTLTCPPVAAHYHPITLAMSVVSLVFVAYIAVLLRLANKPRREASGGR